MDYNRFLAVRDYFDIDKSAEILQEIYETGYITEDMGSNFIAQFKKSSVKKMRTPSGNMSNEIHNEDYHANFE